jgi:hypothetical protein
MGQVAMPAIGPNFVPIIRSFKLQRFNQSQMSHACMNMIMIEDDGNDAAAPRNTLNEKMFFINPLAIKRT